MEKEGKEMSAKHNMSPDHDLSGGFLFTSSTYEI